MGLLDLATGPRHNQGVVVHKSWFKPGHGNAILPVPPKCLSLGALRRGFPVLRITVYLEHFRVFRCVPNSVLRTLLTITALYI